MTQISVISKQSHQVLEQVDANRVGLKENSVVVVKVPKEDVASITRDGNNAVITLKSGETIVIENYFANESADNSLVFEGEDGGLFWAKFTDANGAIADVIQYQPLADVEPLLYKDSLVGAILPWALGAAGAGAIGAALNDDDKDDSNPAPAVSKLAIPELTDNTEPQIGKIAAGGSTNDKTPVVSGAGAEPGAIIKIYDGSQQIAETVAKPDGTWSVEVSAGLADGSHSITASQTVGGVEGPKSDALNFTVDTKDPSLTIDDLKETNDTTPTISGKTDEPNASIDVVIKDENGNVVDSGKGVVDGNGGWTYTPGKPLPEGEYTVEVTAKDPAGNETSADKDGLVVDTTDPSLTIDPLEPTGNDKPVIGGTTDPDATIDVVIKDQNGNVVDSGTGTVDGNGDWTYTPSKPLPEGEYTVEVTAKDPAGNDKTETGTGLEVDKTLPAISIDPLKPTNDDTPAITGKADADAAVKVEIKDASGNVVDSGNAVTDGNGGWTYTPSQALPEGSYTVEATATDPVGNDSKASDSGLKVDTTAPAVSINPLAPTNDSTPEISGQTESGATVKVEIKDASGNVVDSGNAVTDGNGGWTYTPSQALPEGPYTVEATAKDPAGNQAKASDAGLEVDTTAPSVSINPLAPTNDSTPEISGQTESGATVKVEVKDAAGDVIETGSAVVSPAGEWTYTPKHPLADGSYSVTATASDAAGNEGSAHGSGLVVDISALSISINPLQPTKDTTPEVSGKTSPNVSVEVVLKDKNGHPVDSGTVQSDASGNWTYISSAALPEGEYTVKATATNAAGTKANAQASGLIIDTTLPVVTIDTLPLTNDATPTVTGTTEKGATVYVQINDEFGNEVAAGQAAVDANGIWTYTPPADLPDGCYSVVATATDSAGNQDSAVENGLEVDTVPPLVSIEPLALTNVTEPVIKGTSEPHAKVLVEVRDGQGNVVASDEVQADSNGEWSYQPTAPLADDKYEVTATATDRAGNPASAIDSGLEIDTVPPTVDIDNLFGAAAARMLMSAASTTSASLPQTNQIKPTFSGSSTKSVEVMIYLQDESGTTVDSGKAELNTATGKWTYTPSQNLAEGYYMLQAISKDAAGNQSAPAAKAFIVDTQAPVVEVDDVGLTNDATPDVKGKVNEPASTVTVKVADAAGKVVETGIATVASDGKWSYTVKTSLGDGDYVVSATAKDKAGNISAEDSATAKIDTAAPTSALTVSPTGEVVITFSEAVKGFDKSDVTVNGGTLLNLTQQADGSWKGQVVADGATGANGKVDVIIADNSYTDTAGNAGKGSSVLGTDVPSVDTTAPAAAISVDPNGNVVVTFSEPVKGFEASDVKVTGGKLLNLAEQPDGSWTGKVAADGATGAPGSVTLDIKAASYTDLAGNAGLAATKTETVPSIDTTGPAPALALDANGNLTITFSEPVKDFDLSDVKVSNGSISGFAQQPDGSWTGKVVANGVTGASASVVVSITEGTYTDLAGNAGKSGFVIETIPSVDTTAPTSAIVLDANGNLTITFSEAVKGFDENDVTVTGGTVSGLKQNADGSWSGKVAADGNTGALGTVTVAIADNSYTDLAGNDGKGSTASKDIPSIDSTAPTSSITLAADGSLKITFSEAVKGFDEKDVTVTGGTVSGLKQNADGSWSGKVAADGNTGALGTVTVAIADNSYTDLAGNDGKGSSVTKDVPSIDTTAPSASIVIAPNGDVTISFSEPVKGFDKTDVKVDGGTISGLTEQPDGSWTGHVVANDPTGAPGQVEITIDKGSYTDNAGNPGEAASGTQTVPSIDVTAPSAFITLNANGDITISFSEAVKGFDKGDVNVAGGKLIDLTEQPDGTWTGKVAANGSTGASSSIAVEVAAGSYTDLAGNSGKGATAVATVPSIDSTAPTSSITLAADGSLKITFSEAVKGFDEKDVTVTGGTVSDLKQNADGSWSGKVAADGNTGALGTVTVAIADNSYTDLAGNDGKGSSVTKDVPSIDTTAPSASIVIAPNGDVTISFSEPVKGFDKTDVKVDGGTISGLTEQPDGSWTGHLVANDRTGAPGLVEITIDKGSYTDNAGNPGEAASGTQIVPGTDTIPPTSSMVLDKNGNLTITFSEAVKGFDEKDVTVTGGALSGLKQNADGTWSAKVAADGVTGAPGIVTVTIADNSYTDLAGNNGKGSIVKDVSVPSIDSTAPTSSITLAADGSLKITFSEAVKGFDKGDVNVAGGKLIDLIEQPDGSWSGKVVADGNTGALGTVTVAIADNSYTDLAGNDGKGSSVTKDVPSIDTTAPSASIVIAPNGDVTISFSEPVKGFDKTDVNVVGGTISGLTEQPDGSWTGHVVANDPTGAPGQVNITIDKGSYTDNAGNPGEAASGTQTVPSIDVTAPSAFITLNANGDITISFSEAVKGFEKGDVNVAGGKLIDLIEQPDGTWTGKVAANGSTGASGSIAVEVAANSYTDLAGNAGKGATAVAIVPSIDTAAPTSAITLAADGSLKITFSEAVKGFDEKDVTVTGGTVSDLKQNADGSWSGKVAADGNTGALGTVTVAIADNSYTDLAGNNGKGSSVTKDVPSIDTTAPSASIVIAPNGDVTISFSEPVKGFDKTDVKVDGGTISGLTEQPDGSWTGHVVANDPTGAPGQVNITIDKGSYTDNAGNPGEAASGTQTVPGTDTTAPTSSMVLDKNGNLTITFSEAVKGFDEKDVTVTGGALSGLKQNADGTWSAKVTTADASGSAVTVELDDKSYTDLAGNAGKGSSVQQTVDSTAPSASIALDNQGNVIVSFSEKVTGFDPADLKVTGAIVKNLTEQADGTWKGEVQVPTIGVNTPVQFEIAAGSYEDASGNKGLEVILDTIVYPPTVEIDPFDFFAAPASAQVMQFAARTLLAAEPLLPATNNPKQTFNGSSVNSVEVKINIYDSSDNLVESGLAVLTASTGRWSYTPAKPLADGQFRLEAISKDIYGVTSAPATIKFIIDTVKPVIDIDDSGIVSDATPSFSGKTEANATVTVTVKDAAGNVLASGAAAVGADGSWTYTAPNLADGTYTVEAVAKDRAGNLSDPDATSVTVDTVAQLDALTVTPNADGTATVSGKSEPGAAVKVTDPNGNNVPAVVNPDGTFTAVVPAPAAEGTYTATATDKAGNSSSAAADLDDNVAPKIDGLDVTPNTDGSATVTGKTEPGAAVKVTDPNGNDVPAVVNPDGTFTAVVPAPAAEGTYTATATDKAGNSGSAAADLDDNVAPAVTVDLVSNPDGTATVTGKTEPGATVKVTDPNGNDYPATVNPDGTFTAVVPSPAAEGTYTATATDKAGNSGTATDDLTDTTIPVILTAEVDSQTGGFVFGKSQPGAVITVYAEDGQTVLGMGTVNAAGEYSVNLTPAQVDGEQVKVTAKDPGGESAPITAAAPDLYAPDAPTAQVAADGKSVSGLTEPNAIVQVYGGSKGTTVIGTAVAGADGKYTAPLNPALVDGEHVKVTAKDPGGESLATPATAPDLYAPDAPTATVNAKGDTVSGEAEADSDIKVYAQDGITVIARGKSDADGNYSIKLPAAYTDGQTLLVSASDAGGESGKTGAKAPIATVDAVDNLVDAAIDFKYPVLATRTSELFNKFVGFNIGEKTFTGGFVVGDNEVANATITVTTKSLINLFDLAEMKLYKVVNGVDVLVGTNKDAGLFDLLGIFGESTQIQVKNLLPGEYKFAFSGGSLIGVGTSIKAGLSLQVFDTAKDPVVTEVTDKSGNVITDADGVYGKDVVPAGTTVTAVNGKAVNVSGTTVITGDHGTLTIAKDGSYTYKPAANVENIGKSEVFSYTVTDPATGKTDTANLIIHIGTASDLAVKWDAADPKNDASTVVATDNTDVIGVQATNTMSAGESKSISYTWFVGFLGAALGKTSGSTEITVKSGTIENVNINFGSAQLASFLGETQVIVKNAFNETVASARVGTLIDAVGIFPNGNSLSIPGLKAGKYTIEIVTNSGLISAGGSVKASISRSVIDLDDFTSKSLATQTQGNLLTDNDGHGVDVLASKYTDLYISADGINYKAVTSTGVTVKGAHGNLTIKADGSYTYSVTDPAFKAGEGDQFTYKLVAPNGDTSVAHLDIETGYVYNTSIGNDVITSSVGNDVYTTNAGADTVIFKLLNTAEATGGNGHDTWTDFKKADGDKIDISELLQGQNVTASNIGDYVSVAKDGHGNTVISIDRDGQGSSFTGKTDLLTLKNTDVTLQDLLDNNHLIF